MVNYFSNDMLAYDIETHGTSFGYLPEPMQVVVSDPYKGLNRAQRRAAVSKENRAFKKRIAGKR